MGAGIEHGVDVIIAMVLLGVVDTFFDIVREFLPQTVRADWLTASEADARSWTRPPQTVGQVVVVTETSKVKSQVDEAQKDLVEISQNNDGVVEKDGMAEGP